MRTAETPHGWLSGHRSEARSARCRPSHCSLATRSITMHCGSTATADAFVPVARSGRRELLDAADNAAFAWSFDTETYPKAAFTIRSADDQELDWEVGPDLRPRKHPIRDTGSRLAARSLPCGILGHHMRSVTTVRSTAG